MARAGCWKAWGCSICPGITEVNGILAIVFNRARVSLCMPKKALYHTVVLSAMTFTANEINVPHLTWLLVYLYRSSRVFYSHLSATLLFLSPSSLSVHSRFCLTPLAVLPCCLLSLLSCVVCKECAHKRYFYLAA